MSIFKNPIILLQHSIQLIILPLNSSLKRSKTKKKSSRKPSEVPSPDRAEGERRLDARAHFFRCRVQGFHLQDLRSACRVRLRSRGVVRVAGVFVAVFTRDSSSSSSPSVRLPFVCSFASSGPSAVRPAIREKNEKNKNWMVKIWNGIKFIWRDFTKKINKGSLGKIGCLGEKLPARREMVHYRKGKILL